MQVLLLYRCEVIFLVCSQPYKPTDGNIILSDNGYKVSSICNRGYSLSGNPHRSCQPDGTGWNGSSPVCGKHFLNYIFNCAIEISK